jgi:hypothetical protein
VKPSGFGYHNPVITGPTETCEPHEAHKTTEISKALSGETTGANTTSADTTSADTTSADTTSAGSLNNTDDGATNKTVYGMAIVVSAMSTLAF